MSPFCVQLSLSFSFLDLWPGAIKYRILLDDAPTVDIKAVSEAGPAASKDEDDTKASKVEREPSEPVRSGEPETAVSPVGVGEPLVQANRDAANCSAASADLGQVTAVSVSTAV